ncbi:MAG: DUF2807 domain-containing protein [Bacteroidales bacterium]|nr:DUF2807 domain-containing protein [Bacteroidales bacterium]
MMKTDKLLNIKKLSILFALSLAVLFFSGCKKGIFCTSGKGEIVTSVLTVGEFNKLEASGAFDIIVSQGDTQIVELEGHQNIIDRVKTSLVNNHLEIDLKKGCYNDYVLTIYITVPDIKEVKLNGSGNITIEEFDELNQLYLIITGSGNIYGNHNLPVNNLSFYISGSGNIDFAATSLNISSEIEGSGNATLSGTTNTHEAIIDGSGSFRTFNLISNNTSINIEGSGDCEVFTNNTLNIDISGSGNVYYKGYPNLNVNISGSGNVFDAN